MRGRARARAVATSSAGEWARKGEAALLASGCESVLRIEGGLAAWQEAGYPVEGGP